MKKRLSIALALVLVMSLAGAGSVSATNGAGYSALFAGTSDPAKVYMYTGSGTAWEDISGDSFIDEYAVLDLVQYEGQLYAATESVFPGHYSGVGRVWRYDGGQNWSLVGDNMDHQVSSLAVFNGNLYAGTSWNAMLLYRYDNPGWTQVIASPVFSGTRALYVYDDILLMGDMGWDRFGHINTSEVFTADLSTLFGSCIYDYEEYGDYVYAAAYIGRLWSAPDGMTWSVVLGPYDGNMWELEEYQGDLYMSYENGELAILGGTANPVLTADDGIISMTTDGTLLYYGIGGEAGAYYGSDDEGTGYVYSYDGSTSNLISGPMGVGVQVLYIGNPGLICDKWIFQEFDLGDGDGTLEVGELWMWNVVVEVQNVSAGDVQELLIKDNMAGDLLLYAVYYPGAGDWVYPEKPDPMPKKKVDATWTSDDDVVTVEWTGKTEKAHVYFDMGYMSPLEPGDVTYVQLVLCTDINTGTGNGKKDGHQEYTEEGLTDLNSGATAKGILYGYEAEAVSDSIEVDVQPYVFTPSP